MTAQSRVRLVQGLKTDMMGCSSPGKNAPAG
jgi:hypothetical protein